MTATDELRAMLDERGVEWDKGKLAMLDDEYTHWWVHERMEGFVAYECDYPLDTLIVRGITPEQAIAATLGDADATPARQVDAGTCHDMGGCRWFRCSACGFGIEDMYVNDEDEYPPEDQPRYCPNCGKKVVDE